MMFGLFKKDNNALHEHKFKRAGELEELNVLDQYGLKRSEIIDDRAKFNHVYKCSCGKVEIKSFIDLWDI